MPTKFPKPAGIPETSIGGESTSVNCAKLKDLGYIAGKRLNLYGEHFQIVSDPFADGDGVAVDVLSGDDPTVQTIRLPAALMVGFSELFPPTSRLEAA